MATNDTNLADRSGNLVESHKSYQPRVIFFYLVVSVLLTILAAGLEMLPRQYAFRKLKFLSDVKAKFHG